MADSGRLQNREYDPLSPVPMRRGGLTTYQRYLSCLLGMSFFPFLVFIYLSGGFMTVSLASDGGDRFWVLGWDTHDRIMLLLF